MSLLLQNVRHSYALTEVLGGVGLALSPGRVLALVGPSGCGKTTLLHLCAGLLDVQEGRLENSFATPALMFQQPRLLPWQTTADNIALGLRAQGMARSAARERAHAMGAVLGLDAEANALGDERKGATDDYFTANVCFAWSLQILADTAAVLQYTEDARRWSRRREELVRAFRAEYVTPTGRLVSETQTALILALHFDMVPDEFRPRLLDALEKNIGAHKTHLLTGFIGTPFACLTLSENGRHDLAGRLLLQEDDPSWLYEVKMGATTIWERWNSIRPDGSFNPANMNSLNHYAYGSIGNWLYTKLCGLENS